MQAAIATTGHGGKRQGGVGHPKDQYVGVDHRTRLVVAKAEKEEYQARLAALEVAEREGSLISRAASNAATQQLISNAKAKLLSIPAKAAPQIVAMTSIAEVQDLLLSEICQALEELARGSDRP